MRGGGTVNADGFGAGWYPRAPAATRSATAAPSPIWSDTSFAALAARRPRPRRCWPRSARPPSACRSPRPRRRRSPRAAGCSATTAWSAAGRARWRRSPRALPVTDLLTLDAPTDSALLWALVRAPPARRRRPGRRARRRGHRGRGRRARLAAEPAAHRRHDDLGHRLGPRAVGARRADDASLVASEPIDADPGWTGVPDRHLVVARPGPLHASTRSPTTIGRLDELQPLLDIHLTDARRRGRAAGRRPGRAHRHAQAPAAQVVLRRPRQRAVRADHRAARVLPDPHRAGAAGAQPSTRSPRRRGADTLVELGSGSSVEDPAAAGRVHAGPARCAATCRRTSASRRCGRRWTRWPPTTRASRCTAWSATSPATWTGCPRGDRRMVAFLGGTIGNLLPAERAAFLTQLAVGAAAGGAAAAGHRAGDRRARCWWRPTTTRPGVTAEFNRNVLRVLNRELGADFDVEAFAHRALWDARARVDRDAAGRAAGDDRARGRPRPRRRVRRRARRSHGDLGEVPARRGARDGWRPPASRSPAPGPTRTAVSR